MHHLVDPLLAQSATLGAGLDWKTSLQEITSRHGLGAPEYTVTEEGPEHAKSFEAEVIVDGDVLGRGSGRTKKVAEQEAAALAWTAIRDAHEGPVVGPEEEPRPEGDADELEPGGPPRRAVPELPEVEVVRRGLAEHVLGRTVSERRAARSPGRPPPRRRPRRTSPTASPGAGSTRSRRRGKYLWLDLGDSLGLILHLGMSGQLLVEDAAAPDEKHLHARFRFADDGPELRFVDQRTFGGLALTDLDAHGMPDDDRAHRARPARAGLRPGRRRAPGQGQGQRDQAGAARPDRRVGHRQHLRRRGALAGAACTASGSRAR